MPVSGAADTHRPVQPGAATTTGLAVAAVAATQAKPARLLSLDVFRGVVILAMLIVNNPGDYSVIGYFWKHPDWREGRFAPAFARWWESLASGAAAWHTAFTQFPLWRHCTLADFIMPMFMLIIGLAIPYSAASATRAGLSPTAKWWRVVKRAALLVALGWVLCYFRDQFAPWVYGDRPFSISLGMDVLQLLGVAYLVARVLYELPRHPRLAACAALLVWHWAFLRFGYQGELVPRGTFEQVRDAATGRMVEHSAVKYAYDHWNIWGFRLTPWLSVSWVGLLSVPPAAGMMLLGTFAGDWMRDTRLDDRRRGRGLALAGAALALIGIAWAFDLPMNKPRWTPAYLVYCAGVGFMALALLYWLIDLRRCNGRWTTAFVALGVNAIAAYWLTIMFKVLVLNLPRVTYDGKTMSLTAAVVRGLQDALNSPWAGGWAFTLLFVGFWWAVFGLAYRYRIAWRI